MIRYRKALPQDARGIAHVHIASWQTSYRGLIPDEVLDNQSFERRETYWQHITASSEALHFVLVAENAEGEIVGFTSAGKSRQENLPFVGELYAIYLLSSYQTQGVGTQLFRKVIAQLRTEGISSMMLWVLAENLPGRRFYEKMGGKYVTEQTITIGGRDLSEVAYGWDALTTWFV
jgi:GNAT superfamily N-acetyltransferase